jgi:hypothetical protein
LERRLYENVAILAAEHERIDVVRRVVKYVDASRLADSLMQRNLYKAASVCYENCHAYEKAARASMRAGDYATASLIFEQLNQYMNAIMCS